MEGRPRKNQRLETMGENTSNSVAQVQRKSRSVVKKGNHELQTGTLIC